jgi:hypothetical protein
MEKEGKLRIQHSRNFNITYIFIIFPVCFKNTGPLVVLESSKQTNWIDYMKKTSDSLSNGFASRYGDCRGW